LEKGRGRDGGIERECEKEGEAERGYRGDGRWEIKMEQLV